MRLFDEVNRKTHRPKTEHEPLFDYYNISARRTVVAFRELVEAWFQRYPQDVRKEFRGRFRSPIDAHHRGAFFELDLHELILSMGFTIDIHPKMNERTTTQPDFIVSKNEQPCFYLEATSALPSQEESAKEKIFAQLYDYLNEMHSPNFFVAIEPHGSLTNPPPGKSLRRELEQWLSTLNPDELRQSLEVDGFRGLPRFNWTYKNWSISFLPIAKSVGLRGKRGVRPIGMTLPSEAKFIDSYSPIKKAVAAKATKYGELNLPFIVAVNVFDIHADSIDLMDALFGREAIQIREGFDGVISRKEIRQPDGVWVGPRGPQNTRISGALFTVNLSPWAMATITPVLIHHPWASKPILPELWPLTQQVPNRQTFHMEERLGKNACDFLSLPTPWPIPDIDDTNT